MKPKRGDVREDGLRFWCTNRGRNVWVTREKFDEKIEKSAAIKRQYRQANKEKVASLQRKYQQANKGKSAYHMRRYNRRKAFAKENGSSFVEWLSSIKRPSNVFAAIANLTPDPGQTLAELIHELSGYAMEVCEQIADPPVAEETPELTPPVEPDLF